jgi:radical SAM superfamily enzyme
MTTNTIDTLMVLADEYAIQCTFMQDGAGLALANKARAKLRAALANEMESMHNHVGDSSFEGWYQTYDQQQGNMKQIARDAYAAGMGDPLISKGNV